LGEPLLLDLIVDGAPAYAWPADQHHVWQRESRLRFASLIEFLTRPRNSHERLELAWPDAATMMLAPGLTHGEAPTVIAHPLSLSAQL